MAALLSPSGSVDALKSAYTSEALSILFNWFATAIIDALSRSITGDTFGFVVDKVRGMNNDFAPASSFVSFIVEQTILVVSKSKFSPNANVLLLVSVTKEVSEPLGLVPLVDLILPIILVFGSSNVEIWVLNVSNL